MTEFGLSKGKSFIITGGANSLGAAYVEAFLKEGAKNIAIVDIDVKAGEALSQKLNEDYANKTIFVKCDVSKEKDIAEAFEYVLKEFKQIDVIINNAGVMNDSEKVWRKASDVNWQGVASFTRKGVSHMRKDEGGVGGTIVNVSSVAGFITVPFVPTYGGSKAAVLHFSLSLAGYPFHERTGIRILTICFAPTQTPLLEGLVEKCTFKDIAAKLEDEKATSEYQLVDSAVAAMVKMFQVGDNGSVWLSSKNRPAEDITHIFKKNEEELRKIMDEGLDV